MTRFRSILLTVLTIAVVGLAFGDQGPGGSSSGDRKPGGPSGKERRAVRSNDGEYVVSVSGSFKGTGKATVTTASVSISADVVSESGGTATLKSDPLVVSGPYFTGTGTVGDVKVTIKGRLDAAKSSRLVATYNSDTVRGRIVGTLPGDPPQDSWIGGDPTGSGEHKDDDKDDDKH